MAIQGKVIEVKTKSGKTNGRAWNMYTYVLDNNKEYTTFKDFSIKKGDTVAISMENKNNKWVVKDIKKLATQQKQTPSSNNNNNTFYNNQNSTVNFDKELSIQRQSSLKAAIDIVNNNLDIAKVIQIAELLVSFCQNGNSAELEERISIILENQIDLSTKSNTNENVDDDVEAVFGGLDE